jgi:hypothetical protein
MMPYVLDDLGFDSWQGRKVLSSPKRPNPAAYSMGTGNSFPGGKSAKA